MFFGGEEFRQIHPGLRVSCFEEGNNACLSLAIKENTAQVFEDSPSCLTECLKLLEIGERYVLLVDSEGGFAGRAVFLPKLRIHGGRASVWSLEALKQNQIWIA